MVIALSYLSYEQYKLGKQLNEWKNYYNSIAISNVQAIMEPPELKVPNPKDMDVTLVDFDVNLLQFEDLNGSQFSLRDFKGKTLFINYWATWCNPCLAEMPSMVELYNQYKDCLLYTSPSPRDGLLSRMPSSA